MDNCRLLNMYYLQTTPAPTTTLEMPNNSLITSHFMAFDRCGPMVGVSLTWHLAFAHRSLRPHWSDWQRLAAAEFRGTAAGSLHSARWRSTRSHSMWIHALHWFGGVGRWAIRMTHRAFRVHSRCLEYRCYLLSWSPAGHCSTFCGYSILTNCWWVGRHQIYVPTFVGMWENWNGTQRVN